MTDLRKAAEMALEALEWNYGTDLENIENCTAWLDKMNATIPALRQALAMENFSEVNQEIEEALRQALEQNDLEEAIAKGTKAWADVPNASAWLDDLRGNVDKVDMSEERVDETVKSEHEPEWIEDGFGTMWQKCGKKDCGKFVVRVGKVDCWNGDCPEKEPKREWVGLTDEEKGWCGAPTLQETVTRVEAKLKEKNA